MFGWYVFSDYCSGIITGLRMQGRVLQRSVTLGQLPNVSSVRIAPDGELWVTSIGGEVAEIVPA